MTLLATRYVIKRTIGGGYPMYIGKASHADCCESGYFARVYGWNTKKGAERQISKLPISANVGGTLYEFEHEVIPVYCYDNGFSYGKEIEQ